MRRAIKAAARRAGLGDDLTTHDTRRLCASLLRASGVRIEVAMAILGHKSMQMLVEVYARALDGEHLRAAEQLQAYVYGASAGASGG